MSDNTWVFYTLQNASTNDRITIIENTANLDEYPRLLEAESVASIKINNPYGIVNEHIEKMRNTVNLYFQVKESWKGFNSYSEALKKVSEIINSLPQKYWITKSKKPF